MKTGIFGGTFNPVHKGHLKMAELLIFNKLLEQIIFVPAAYPPLKSNNITDFASRFRMIELAIENKESMHLSDIENRLPKPSYSLRTMAFLKDQYKCDQLYFILGTDNLKNIHRWYMYEKFINENKFILLKRNSQKLPDMSETKLAADLFKKVIENTADTPLIEVSSTEIREHGADKFQEMLPEKVFNYIQEKKLYSQ